VAVLLGIGLSIILFYSFDIIVGIEHDLFFYYFLPPIILAEGYNMKKEKFFKYLHLILIFGIMGTII